MIIIEELIKIIKIFKINFPNLHLKIAKILI